LSAVPALAEDGATEGAAGAGLATELPELVPVVLDPLGPGTVTGGGLVGGGGVPVVEPPGAGVPVPDVPDGGETPGAGAAVVATAGLHGAAPPAVTSS